MDRAFVLKAEQTRIEWNAADEGLGSINWVDHPASRTSALLAAFLTQNRLAWKGRGDRGPDVLLRLDIGDRDWGRILLPLDCNLLLKELQGQLASLFKGLKRKREPGRHALHSTGESQRVRVVYTGQMSEGIWNWFAGPKAENADWFEGTLGRIVQDYYAWRRNYFPEDGVVVDSHAKRQGEEFRDEFEDRLLELLGRLKSDFPFQSPRYVAHMLAEQSLPGIAGYIAAMLYNPNNVSREAAPVTVRLELEACKMINRMLGYGDESWGHLCSGGTVANIEALWVARTVHYLPHAIAEMRSALGLCEVASPKNPMETLTTFGQLFDDASERGFSVREVIQTYQKSAYCVVERGIASVASKTGFRPVLVVPESHHYCFEKAMDIMGLGREALISVRVDKEFRLDVSDLRLTLDRAAASRQEVFGVVAVVGTTEEGAVDPVHDILDLRAERESQGKPSYWIHVDGAYGGYLRSMTHPSRIGLGEPWTDAQIAGQKRRVELRLPTHSACDALERLGECDSITIDPHKLGYIPYPAGAIGFRSDLVRPIVRQQAPYIEEEAGGPELERHSQGVGVYILEGSKPGAAAAAVWLSHSLIPLDNTGHGLLIQETVRNAAELYSLLTEYPNWSLEQEMVAVPLCQPGSNILCIAFRPKSGKATLQELNELNQTMYRHFTVPDDSNRRMYDQKFFVSRTTVSVGQYRTQTVAPFLQRLGISESEYEKSGVFLLRMVLMNPWYSLAKSKGRHYLAELTEELYAEAMRIWSSRALASSTA